MQLKSSGEQISWTQQEFIWVPDILKKLGVPILDLSDIPSPQTLDPYDSLDRVLYALEQCTGPGNIYSGIVVLGMYTPIFIVCQVIYMQQLVFAALCYYSLTFIHPNIQHVQSLQHFMSSYFVALTRSPCRLRMDLLIGAKRRLQSWQWRYVEIHEECTLTSAKPLHDNYLQVHALLCTMTLVTPAEYEKFSLEHLEVQRWGTPEPSLTPKHYPSSQQTSS